MFYVYSFIDHVDYQTHTLRYDIMGYGNSVHYKLLQILTSVEIIEIFNRFNKNQSKEYFWNFNNKEDAEACTDYLNNTYGVMFKLMGE